MVLHQRGICNHGTRFKNMTLDTKTELTVIQIAINPFVIDCPLDFDDIWTGVIAKKITLLAQD